MPRPLGAFIKEEEMNESNSPPESAKKGVYWSETEDYMLYQIICCKHPESFTYNDNKIVKIKWSKIAHELNSLIHRDLKSKKLGKHCRERWINHLNPRMNKGQWTNEEDLKLVAAFVKFGKKWASISQELPKRSQHAIKNRFYHLMAKHLNVTNREVIKSRENYRSEAVSLLSSLSSSQKKRMAEIDIDVLIKKEDETSENRPLSGSISQGNSERFPNSSGFLPIPDFRFFGASPLMNPMRFCPTKAGSFPFNSLSLLYQNLSSNLRK